MSNDNTVVPKPPPIVKKKGGGKEEKENPNVTGNKRKRLEDYNSKTKNQLKSLCRTQGLRVGGSKMELIARLMNPTEAKKTKRLGSIRQATVIKKLEALKIKAGNVSSCIKRAIQRRFIDLDVENPLEQVVYKGSCWCGHEVEAKLKDVLYQSDYGGDYEDGGEGASLKCPSCKCGVYLTGMCTNQPSFDSGKFHNHCTECKGFGICIGDYRTAHCHSCGKHYFQGLSGFKCVCKERGNDFGFGFGGGRRGRRGGGLNMNGCAIQ